MSTRLYHPLSLAPAFFLCIIVTILFLFSFLINEKNKEHSKKENTSIEFVEPKQE